MGSLKLYHRRPHGGSYVDKGGRGGRRKAKARLAPSAVTAILPDWPATPARLRSWRRRNPLTEPMLTLVGPSQEGGGLCRPVGAPARVSQARKGRERPRLCIADVAPEPSSGVAHAPHVSVDDVLGRVCEAGRIPARTQNIADETAPRNRRGFGARVSVDFASQSYPFCGLREHWCQRFAIHRDTGTGNPVCEAVIRSCTQMFTRAGTDDAPTGNSAGAIARVKASLRSVGASRP